MPNAPPDIGIERAQPPTQSETGILGDEPARVDTDEFTDDPDQIRSGILVVVLVLVLVAVLVLLLQFRWLRRDRKLWVGAVVDEDGTSMPVRLRRAAERARSELAARASGPPDDAVIAAWLTLEQATEAEGVGRAPHQTPTEFTAALLGRYTTDEPALDELRALYQRARFGTPGEVGERDVQDARTALDRILRALSESTKV